MSKRKCDDTNALSAYNVCLDFEGHAVAKGDKGIIICARILGYLILHAPSPIALREIVKQIHSCNRDYDILLNFGDHLVKYFLRPFKKINGRTPYSSNHSSRPSFDKGKEHMMTMIKETPRDHMDAKKQALIRDDFRCIVTGKYDADAAISSGITNEELVRAGCVHTECAYIVPESTHFGVSTTDTKGSPEKDYAASALAVLKSFGYDVDNLNGPKVHSLYNVMTMQKDVHDWFDRLEMWFEATKVQNCYRIMTSHPGFMFQLPEQIIFTSSCPDTLPVPSPQLLALHAACAKVAHLSGAGEYIDEMDRGVDELHVLAYDGCSFDVLNHAILRSTGFVK